MEYSKVIRICPICHAGIRSVSIYLATFDHGHSSHNPGFYKQSKARHNQGKTHISFQPWFDVSQINDSVEVLLLGIQRRKLDVDVEIECRSLQLL
jgi:hypothetical protein